MTHPSPTPPGDHLPAPAVSLHALGSRWAPLRRGASAGSRLFAAAAWLGLAACGGGGGGSGSGGGPAPSASCSAADEKVWLRDFFADTYFWNTLAPRPDPAPFESATRYFSALLYAGGDPIPSASGATWPRDRWSSSQSTERYNQFYGEARTMGYGLAVAGLEVKGQPTRPLYVRQVDPNSAAALNDVRRGDRVVSVNGRPASELIAADDFSALSATATGQLLTLRLARGSAERDVSLASAVYDLVPVPQAQVVTTPGGRRVGYLQLQNFISQAQAPLESRFAEFRAQGVQEMVLDLRYNGGGLVSFSGTVASHLGGTRAAGQVFASLVYAPSQARAGVRLPGLRPLAGLQECGLPVCQPCAGGRRERASGDRSDGPAHLLGQRARHQWSARCRSAGGGHRGDELRQACGLRAWQQLRHHLEHRQLREPERARRGSLLRWHRGHLPGGGRLHAARGCVH